jgi:hypothetical protein
MLAPCPKDATMTRPPARRAALIGGAGVAALALLWHLTPADAADAAKPGVARELRWEELVPKDWDPLKRFRDAKLGAYADTDPRAVALMKEMRETWDNAPTNAALNGQSVRIAGYLVPLEEVKGELKQFLLVPYFGACIHTPPPPANQIVDVRPTVPVKGYTTMSPVWVHGVIRTARDDTAMGVSGYRLEAVKVEAYDTSGR